MTPKEKAEELVNKFKQYSYDVGKDTSFAKQCALIAVDEIISVLNPEHWGIEMNIAIDELIYWREVKKEIESL